MNINKRKHIKKSTLLLNILIITSLLASSLLLSSCKKKSSDEDSTDESGKKLTNITLMLDWTPNTNHTGIYVAKELGYYKEAGINLTILESSEAGPEVSVASGVADFGISFQDTLVPAFSSDDVLPITAIAAIIQHNTSGIVSLKNKGIATPKDMSGHNYATLDLPIEQAIIKKVVNENGGDYSKIDLVSTYVSDIVAALKTNIDTVWIYRAWDGIACDVAGLDTNFFYFKDYAAELDYYSPVIIANNGFLTNNEAITKAFLDATTKGYEYAINNPDASAELLVNSCEGLSMDICKRSQEWLADQYKADAACFGIIDQKRWDAFYSWVYKNGLCEKEIPSGYGFTNKYISDAK